MMRLDCFDVFPTLSTARFELRSISMADAPALFAIFSDEIVMRYWGRPPFASMDEARALVEKIEKAYRDKAGIEWGIVERDSGEFIGKCCYHRLEKPHFRAEIGYALARERWGAGRMNEALSAILAYGFASMDLHSVEAQIDADNERSTRTVLRLGFQKEGHLRENFYSSGRFSDTLIFSLIRPT